MRSDAFHLITEFIVYGDAKNAGSRRPALGGGEIRRATWTLAEAGHGCPAVAKLVSVLTPAQTNPRPVHPTIHTILSHPFTKSLSVFVC